MCDHTHVHEVLPELYISGVEGANDISQLKQHSIQRVVNLSGCDDAFPDDFEYLRIWIADDSEQVFAGRSVAP